MTTSTIHLLGTDLEEFKSIIKSALKTVLQENKELFSKKNKEDSEKFLTRKEAADFLKISTTTLWSLDKTQKLPAKRLGGKVLYLKSDLLNFNTKSQD